MPLYIISSIASMEKKAKGAAASLSPTRLVSQQLNRKVVVAVKF